MREQPNLETLLELALKQALMDRQYFYVSCYLKPALETLKEQKEVSKTSH
ncbi:hypothetical protein [Thalassospira tepidiphila]|nr:hypothetical protein MACH01_37670 [Thalassospira tepidiphila]